jgi:lipopolysaccharide transport system ATP-binding protein
LESEVVIKVEDVSKKYCKSLRNSMFYGVMDIGRNMLSLSCRPARLRTGEFWSVQDVSFEVKRGDVVGLIGPNGAGKTTLLKMIHGILLPDKGKITVKGRVGALIAVGAGFHPLLTGRENIYINGAILGMTRKEIEENFDAIVDFADIGDFLDAPVKHYSSGMFVKLGFSIAVHCEPDILLIDEILAVGDTAFQSKCYARLAEIMKRGVAIVMVSHSMDAIRHMCKRAVFLWKGRVREIGDADPVTLNYLKIVQEAEMEKIAAKSATAETKTPAPGNKKGRISSVAFIGSGNGETKQFETGEVLNIRIGYTVSEEIPNPVFAVHFHSNRILYASFISNHEDHLPRVLSGNGEAVLSLPTLHLPAGVYTVGVVLSEGVEFNHIDWHDQTYFIQINKREGHLGLLALPRKWQIIPELTDPGRESLHGSGQGAGNERKRVPSHPEIGRDAP